jgi:hypothetical protein
VTVSWIMFALAMLAIGAAVVAWALWCAEPTGPAPVDPAGDADGVLVEPPGWARNERLVDLPAGLEPRIPPSVVDHTIERVERYLKEQVS